MLLIAPFSQVLPSDSHFGVPQASSVYENINSVHINMLLILKYQENVSHHIFLVSSLSE